MVKPTPIKFIKLILFFLRSFYLMPANNPILIVLALFLVVFLLDGALDRYSITLILYLSVLSHYFVNNMFSNPPEVESHSQRSPLTRYFQVLPLSGRSIFYAYLCSSIVYMLMIYGLLLFILLNFMGLPTLTNSQIIKSVTPEGDTLTILTGIDYSLRGLPFFSSIVIENSLLFGSLSKIKGSGWGISLYLMLTFLYLIIFQIQGQFRKTRISLLQTIFALPLGIFLLLGLVFMADMLFTQKVLGIIIRILIQNVPWVVLLFFILTEFTIIIILIMLLSIHRKLGEHR
ncbi:hypothetical protein JW877_05170 [bacterium]|nr:hypothetical protein [bacterium]